MADKSETSDNRNSKLEDLFNKKRKSWSDLIIPLFEVLSFDIDKESSRKILDAQSYALIYKQQMNEEISVFLGKRAKEDAKIKKLKQQKFVYYATGFGIKTNLGEKGILIDGDIADMEISIRFIETYIDFLRDSVKNLDTFGYSIKNMIELVNYLGKINL